MLRMCCRYASTARAACKRCQAGTPLSRSVCRKRITSGSATVNGSINEGQTSGNES